MSFLRILPSICLLLVSSVSVSMPNRGQWKVPENLVFDKSKVAVFECRLEGVKLFKLFTDNHIEVVDTVQTRKWYVTKSSAPAKAFEECKLEAAQVAQRSKIIRNIPKNDENYVFDSITQKPYCEVDSGVERFFVDDGSYKVQIRVEQIISSTDSFYRCMLATGHTDDQINRCRQLGLEEVRALCDSKNE